MISKTNMPEMAMNIISWNVLHGHTRNPRAMEHDPAGSSSGTAAGIAAGFASCGLGSDTSGSIRLPANACGLVGMRPSLGRWPGEGIVPITRRNDTAGPLGVCVADVALLDAVVMNEAPVQVESANTVLSGLTIAIPDDWIKQAPKPIPAPLLQGLDAAVGALESGGATVLRDSRSFVESVVSLRHALTPEAQSFCHADLQWYLDQHQDRPEHLQTAQQVREKMTKCRTLYEEHPEDPTVVEKLYEKLDADAVAQEAAYVAWLESAGADALLVPSTANELVCNTSWGTDESPSVGKDFLSIAHFCKDLNSIHIPSISLPVPSVKCTQLGCEELPVSVMLLGKPNADRELLSFALALEQVVGGQ